MPPCLAALDYGTSSVKASLFSLDGQQLGSATYEVPIHMGPDGAAIQPVDAVFTAGVHAMADAVHQAAVKPKEVQGLGVTQQRSTFIPVTADGRPLMDSFILWMDLRGVPYARQALHEGRIDEETFYATSGLSMRKYVNPWCKILWLRTEQSELFDTARFESMQTVLLRMLGANDPPLDRSSASPFGLMDLDAGVWSEALCRKLGISLTQLSPLAPGGTVVGKLAAAAATPMGLQRGIPLVLGGGDQACAAIGAGAIHPRQGFVNLGTGACVMLTLDQPLRDPLCTMSCLFHPIAGKWELEGHTQASTIVFKWFRDEFGQQEMAAAGANAAYDRLAALAATIPAGADGLIFLPMFNGSTQPEVHPDARGAMAGLTLRHTRAHVVRALMEGVSMEIRWIMDRIAELAGGLDSIRLAGGASRSPTWNQINADLWQLPVQCAATTDAAALGAAIQAAVGVGLFPDVGAACKAMTGVGESYEPNLQTAARYDDVFDRFLAVYNALLASHAFRDIQE